MFETFLIENVNFKLCVTSGGNMLMFLTLSLPKRNYRD